MNEAVSRTADVWGSHYTLLIAASFNLNCLADVTR